MRIVPRVSIRWCAAVGSLLALATTLCPSVAPAQDSKLAKQEQAIRAAAKEYLNALAKGDSQAVAACWTADGEFIDPAGTATPAAQLVAESQHAAPDGPPAETKVTASKIRFLTPDVAVEDGTSELVWPDDRGPSVRGHFHATWVKQDGQWRLARLCEIPDETPASAGLDELGWMVGTWSATSGDTTLEAVVRWDDRGTSLLRDTKAVENGRIVLRGTQRIGLDPRTGELKSWSFDSDGGSAEGRWTKDGDAWVEQASGVMPNGRAVTATAVVRYDGQDSFVREVKAARIDGQSVPDQELRFTRNKLPQQ